jgi:histone deacetylase complex regulatory component SIN3
MSNRRFGIDGVVSRLQVLFRGHPELIRAFNTFLPSGYKLRDDDRR